MSTLPEVPVKTFVYHMTAIKETAKTMLTFC